MAIKLKTGKTFTPSLSKYLSGFGYYGAIDEIDYNKHNKQCCFDMKFYANSLSRNEGEDPIERKTFIFTGDNFDSNIGNDGLSIPQAYNQALETLTDWESDE